MNEPTPTDIANDIAPYLADVTEERIRQRKKWGLQEHDMPTWMTILGEEYGKLCQSVLFNRFDGAKDDLPGEAMYKEATQVGAVALAIMQAITEGEA